MPAIAYKGSELFYREGGDGPPLLLLPGNTASSACHTGELAHFGQRYRTLALDLPGTGQSGRMTTWPHDWWAAGARAMIDLLDALQVERCALVGTSGGAAVALLAALSAPARVAAVVATASCPATRQRRSRRSSPGVLSAPLGRWHSGRWPTAPTGLRWSTPTARCWRATPRPGSTTSGSAWWKLAARCCSPPASPTRCCRMSARSSARWPRCSRKAGSSWRTAAITPALHGMAAIRRPPRRTAAWQCRYRQQVIAPAAEHHRRPPAGCGTQPGAYLTAEPFLGGPP